LQNHRAGIECHHKAKGWGGRCLDVSWVVFNWDLKWWDGNGKGDGRTGKEMEGTERDKKMEGFTRM
jgi:hypothetical protein